MLACGAQVAFGALVAIGAVLVLHAVMAIGGHCKHLQSNEINFDLEKFIVVFGNQRKTLKG